MCSAELLYAAGIEASEKSDIAAAATLIERAIAAAAADGVHEGRYFRGLCEAYRLLGRSDEALAAGGRAVELTPEDLHCHLNLALVHYDRLELDEAIGNAERALALDPQSASAHFQLGVTSLLKGDFARGWAEYEWRFGTRRQPLGGRPYWDGRSLGRRSLLLVADQGFGDIIQFARYIPWAAQRSPNIVVYCDAKVAPIVSQQRGVRRLWLPGGEPPDVAAWIPISGLPCLAGTRLDTIPAKIPYVRAEPAKAALWAEQLASRAPASRRVGIVWAGNPSYANDRNRSMALADLAPLGEAPDVTLVSLQKGPARAQIRDYRGRAPLVDLGEE